MPQVTLESLRTSVFPLILSMRGDLRALGFDRPENWPAFKQWLLNHGLLEYPALHDMLLQLAGRSDGALPPSPCPFGVNLVGYAFGELGIGEDVRMAARALLAADVPMTLLNFKPGDDIPQNDRSMAKHVTDNPQYAVNIFCMTAQENGRQFLESKAGLYGGRYNIGYWPWELSGWPKDWELSFDLVDEIWVSTWHTYQSLADISPKPLMHMPMAVDLPEVRRFRSRAAARKHFKLPASATLYCFSFDLNSSIHRKNPQACVDAFIKAFPKRQYSADQVGLVIKVHTPKEPHPVWDKLKKLVARDPRIHIVEGTLPKAELLALYKACDSFLSLHRAEGFGRGIAEALQLGLHVITTGYSGNVDFCKPPHAELVNYTLIPIKKGQYPFSDGQVWADPDISHAAELMQRFFAPRQPQAGTTNTAPHPPHPQQPSPAKTSSATTPLAKADWSGFSGETVGKRYKQRLEQIRTENPSLFARAESL